MYYNNTNMASSISRSDSIDEVPNLCVYCGIDLGSGNPRQYCRKTYCPKMFFESVPDQDDTPRKKRKRELEEEIDSKLKRVRSIMLDVEQIEKDIKALQEALEEE